MCMMRNKTPEPDPIRIAAPDNIEANRQSAIESRLRQSRAGAAANVLTGALGIPAGAARRTGEVVQ